MLCRRIALAFSIDRCIYAALGADRVRTLDRNDRDQIDLVAGLRDLHRRREPRKAAADYRNF